MDTYTYVYSHAFRFELEQAAEEFKHKFRDYVNVGKD